MISILLAFVTSFGYGMGDFLAGRVAQRLAPALIVLYVQAVQSVAVLIIALVTRQPLALPALVWGIGAGLLNALGLMLYYQALKIGRAGVVAPLVASGAVVPVLVSIAQGTIPSLLTLAGLLSVLLGVVVSTLASGSHSAEPECPSPPCRGATRSLRQPRRVKWLPKLCIVMAVAAALAFGAFFVLFNQGSAVAGRGVLWVAFGVQLGALPTTLISILVAPGINSFAIAETAILFSLGLITLLNLGADASLAYALSLGNLGIVSVLASLGPVFTSLLARVVTSERLSRLQLLGAGLVLLGTLLVVYKR